MSLLSRVLADAARCHNPPQQDLKLGQACLEYAWGLPYGGLEDHLQLFSDPNQILADERVLLLPHRTNIHQLMARDTDNLRDSYRYPIMEAYHGATSFTYLATALAPSHNPEVSPEIIQLDIPPHVIIVMTFAKLARAFPHQSPPAINARVIHAVKAACKRLPSDHDFRFALHEMTTMDDISAPWFVAILLPTRYRNGWPFPLPLPRQRTLPAPEFDPRMANWTFPPEPRRRASPEELAAEIVLKPMKPEDIAKYGGWHLDVEGFRQAYGLPKEEIPRPVESVDLESPDYARAAAIQQVSVN